MKAVGIFLSFVVILRRQPKDLCNSAGAGYADGKVQRSLRQAPGRLFVAKNAPQNDKAMEFAHCEDAQAASFWRTVADLRFVPIKGRSRGFLKIRDS